VRRAALVLALAAGLVLAAAGTAGAVTFTVDTPADEAGVPPFNDSECDSAPAMSVERCSLRAAVQEANAQAATDVIVVPDLGSDYELTIPGAGEDFAATGDLDITAPAQIRGEGQPVIDGLFADRVLHVGPGPGSPALTLAGVELRGGGGVARGAGILVEGGALTLERSTIAGATADAGAGTAEGGGLWLDGGSHAITASTVFGNNAIGATSATGGGIGAESGTSLSLVNSTVSSNVAESGSGAAAGGGLYTERGTTLTHVTMDGNAATGTAGSFGGNVFAAGAINVFFRATIVSGGDAGPGTERCGTLGSGLISQGSNLEAPSGGGSQCGFSTGALDRFGSTAGLTPVADRGGPTPTQALFSISPALDAIPSCFPYTTDQRGEPRPGGVACEIGAFERQEAVPAGATCFGRRPTIVGRKGVNRIIGTPGADVILGSVASELIKARGGKDLICSGKGKDRVKAGESSDRISGEEGDDRLFGQVGKDELRGDSGRDFLDGGPGRDRLSGGSARDTCRPSSSDKLRSC
jgi:CSLREA domain-containing protein